MWARPGSSLRRQAGREPGSTCSSPAEQRQKPCKSAKPGAFNAIDVVVVDSVAALVTKQELEGDIGDSTVGAQARLMSAALRKLTSHISKARTICIFTNQIREKIGADVRQPETTPGGRARRRVLRLRALRYPPHRPD